LGVVKKMLTDGWFLKLSETGVLTRAGKALTKVEIFLKYSLKCVAAWIFSQKHVSRTIAFHVIHISWSKHESKVEIFLKYSWKCVFRLNFFTKTCLTNNYLSCDPHFVILEWVQSWNVFEKLMKQCCLLEFFHKYMSHEQFLFTWSSFRGSSMRTKLKHSWKTRQTVKSARIPSRKHVWRTITFHVIHITWFWHGYNVESFLKNSRKF